MRVIHIDTGREMRGGQWQALFLLRGLARAGVEQCLLAPAGSPLSGRAQEEGFRVEPVTPGVLFRRGAEAQIRHAHTARAHTLASLVPGPPLVVSRRVAFPVRRSAVSRWKYRRAARYLAVSEYVKQDLIAAGIPPDRIVVVPDGTLIPHQASQPAMHSRFVAPFSEDPRKGSPAAAEAARLAGVELHFSRDLARDLRQARALVYISDQEGLGSGAVLAMAYGVPVIASRVGGLPEAVDHESTGLLVENDIRQIAAAITRLALDPHLAARLGAAGRLRAARLFSLDTMVHKTLTVYREIA